MLKDYVPVAPLFYDDHVRGHDSPLLLKCLLAQTDLSPWIQMTGWWVVR